MQVLGMIQKALMIQKSGMISLVLLMCASCASNEIARINTDVNNKLTYKSDAGDYWQTPKETQLLNTGDCEDFAVLKWSKLIDSGIDERSIYFVLVNMNGEFNNHLMLSIDNAYYDLTSWNRWFYDGDFTLIEKFNRFELPKDRYTKNNFLSMLERHDNNLKITML